MTAASASDAPGLIAGRAHEPGVRWRRVFPGYERELAVMRHWLRSVLPDCPVRDDVIYIASELSANAVRHTASGRGGCFAVEITCLVAAVRVAVADCGAKAGPRLIEDPVSENGRGLHVVAGLAFRSGVSGDHRGRLVWADVKWGESEFGGPPEPDEAVIRADQARLASLLSSLLTLTPP